MMNLSSCPDMPVGLASRARGSCVMYGRNVMSTSLLEVSLLGVGTVLRLERDAWSMVK